MSVKDLINQETVASEASRERESPDGIKPVRKNRGTVLSVRLGPEEFDDLTSQADTLGIPVSTLARALIVRGMRESGESTATETAAAVTHALEKFFGPQMQDIQAGTFIVGRNVEGEIRRA